MSRMARLVGKSQARSAACRAICAIAALAQSAAKTASHAALAEYVFANIAACLARKWFAVRVRYAMAACLT